MKKDKKAAKAGKKPRGRKPAAATPPVPPSDETPSAQTNALPFYENAQVVEVLKENDAPGYHHCKMSDGTTKHVPVGLFGKSE